MSILALGIDVGEMEGDVPLGRGEGDAQRPVAVAVCVICTARAIRAMPPRRSAVPVSSGRAAAGGSDEGRFPLRGLPMGRAEPHRRADRHSFPPSVGTG